MTLVTHGQKQIVSLLTHVQVNIEAEARTPILGQMERDRNYKEEMRLIVTSQSDHTNQNVIRTTENG